MPPSTIKWPKLQINTSQCRHQLLYLQPSVDGKNIVYQVSIKLSKWLIGSKNKFSLK